jgi:hypothetical protein
MFKATRPHTIPHLPAMVHACTTALVVVVLALGVLIVYVSSALALFDRGGTLRQLRGPASAHPLVGHMRELLSRAPAVDAWISEHGRIFRSAGLFCVRSPAPSVPSPSNALLSARSSS